MLVYSPSLDPYPPANNTISGLSLIKIYSLFLKNQRNISICFIISIKYSPIIPKIKIKKENIKNTPITKGAIPTSNEFQ